MLEAEDPGLTWSPLRTAGLPTPNAAIDAVLLDERRALIAYTTGVGWTGMRHVALDPGAPPQSAGPREHQA